MKLANIFQHILQNSEECIFLCKSDGTILDYNQAAKISLGIPDSGLTQEHGSKLTDWKQIFSQEHSSPEQGKLYTLKSLEGELKILSGKSIPIEKDQTELILHMLTDVTHGHTDLCQTESARLKERNKELFCLYATARIASEQHSNLESILLRFTQLVPDAFLFPHVACVFLQLDHSTYGTEPSSSEPYPYLQSDILIHRKKRGFIQVYYPDIKLEQNPFLPEEEPLLESLANHIAVTVDLFENESRQSQLTNLLRHADRLATVGKLSAGIAHELNHPLTNILGFSQLLEKYEGMPEECKADLEKITSSCLLARDTIRKLMLFARQLPLKSQEISLNHIIEDVISLLFKRFQSKNIRIFFKNENKLPSIQGDPIQLHQVVVNLLLNAKQSMPQGGSITISTSHDQTHVRCEIADTGHGIQEEHQALIFQPFFTTKEIQEGTGLGLSVVKGIVEEHQGKVYVKQSSEDGTCFAVQLPIKGENIDS
jgi:signal transduction histidine kinase